VGAGLIPLVRWDARWLPLDPLYHIWDRLSPIPARPWTVSSRCTRPGAAG